jgi:hypothetical protein
LVQIANYDRYWLNNSGFRKLPQSLKIGRQLFEFKWWQFRRCFMNSQKQSTRQFDGNGRKNRVTIFLNGQFLIVYTCKPHINHKYSLVIITPRIFSSKMLYVLVKTWAADLYLIYKLEPKARVCISDKDRMRMF